MIKEQIGTAATIEEARKKALAALNAPEDADVTFEVLVQPKKKVLGFIGGSDAKVKAFYEIPDPVAAAPAVKPAKPEKSAAPVKTEKTVKAPVSGSAPVADYLRMMIEGMGVENVEIEPKTEDDEIIYEIRTDGDYGVLIGRHGETLDSVQYLLRLFANKHLEDGKRVSVNVGDYREKRKDNLRALASRSASQVLKFGRSVKLEPMNPYERRIVHTAIQGIEGVTSHSVGYDSERRVVITLEEGVEPTVADKRRYNKGGKGGYNKGGYNKGGKKSGGYQKSQPADANRQPKSDFVSGARYGKIEVKKNEE